MLFFGTARQVPGFRPYFAVDQIGPLELH